MEADAIPIGLCQCGCGQPTNIAKDTIVRYGAVRGQPRRYLRGHNPGRIGKHLVSRETKLTHRNTRAKRYRLAKYNLTQSEFDEMAARQGGCAICGSLSQLCVDHDHKTGLVRGLLCRKCNAAIGLLGESAERIQAAIEYLDLTRNERSAIARRMPV